MFSVPVGQRHGVGTILYVAKVWSPEGMREEGVSEVVARRWAKVALKPLFAERDVLLLWRGQVLRAYTREAGEQYGALARAQKTRRAAFVP